MFVLCELIGMQLTDYRTQKGLTLEEAAEQLGLRSKGHLSDIENGTRNPSAKLAMRIQRWSGGKVRAAALCPAFAELIRLAKGEAA